MCRARVDLTVFPLAELSKLDANWTNVKLMKVFSKWRCQQDITATGYEAINPQLTLEEKVHGTTSVGASEHHAI